MDTTPNLALPYLMAAQAQKHVTHNEAIRMLDALVQLAVIDRQVDTPPGSPNDGDRYIVGPSPGGSWSGNANSVAAFQDGAWAFFAPRTGWVAWVAAEEVLYAWEGTAWVMAGSGSLNPTPLVGINAIADTTNRLSVSSPATLLNHDGAGHQLKVNKAAAADTASLLFQDGFSGRAEMGLAGDDDFHVKVSPDGTTWTDAMVIDRSTGRIAMPRQSAAEDLADLGTIVSGTLMPDPANGQFQTYQNGGAHTLAAPSAEGCYRMAIDMRNGSGAGAVTLSGFDVVSGTENLTLAVGAAFWLEITKISEISKIAIESVGNLTTHQLILVLGESNSGGAAVNADLTATELAARAGLKIWHNTSDAFQNLDIGTNNLISHSGLTDNATHGIENALANMEVAGRFDETPVYLVKAGQGGSVIANWADDQSNYTTAIARFADAMAALDAAEVSYEVKVFISLGINDAIAATSTSTFKSGMEALIADLKADVAADAQFILTNFQAPMTAGHAVYNTVLGEIATADAQVQVVDTTDLPIEDGSHWSAQGFRELGERVADLWYGASGQLAAVTFDPVAGEYEETQEVALSGPVGASIYYSTDDSVPTTNVAQLYSSAIEVTEDTTIKAIAVANGYQNADVAEAAYDLPEADPIAFDATLKGTNAVLSNGDLDLETNANNQFVTAKCTKPKSSGAWYLEFEVVLQSVEGGPMVGLCDTDTTSAAGLNTFVGNFAESAGYRKDFFAENGTLFTKTGTEAGSPLLAQGDIFQIAVDIDNGNAWFGYNNTWEDATPSVSSPTGVFATFTPGTTLHAAATVYKASTEKIRVITADQNTYSPPAGFSAWG